jgi:hypothetical protein
MKLGTPSQANRGPKNPGRSSAIGLQNGVEVFAGIDNAERKAVPAANIRRSKERVTRPSR